MKRIYSEMQLLRHVKSIYYFDNYVKIALVLNAFVLKALRPFYNCVSIVVNVKSVSLPSAKADSLYRLNTVKESVGTYL